MANLVSTEDMAALGNIDISVGLHLTLTYGAALSNGYPRELLNPDGCFDKAQACDPATWSHPEYRLAAWKEWREQLARLREMGVEPDHLDSHHHVHLFEHLFPLALELVQELSVPLRCRSEQLPAAQRAGVAGPAVLVETYFGEHVSKADLFAALNAAPGEVVEVMCHPGHCDELLMARSRYTIEREAELAVLGDPGLRYELANAGWQLSMYKP
jgi:predicted glycoside hydrolase/deacetylase ChbG (UPF0249 family)